MRSVSLLRLKQISFFFEVGELFLLQLKNSSKTINFVIIVLNIFHCLKYDGLSNPVHAYLDLVEADYSLDLSLFLGSEL